MILQNRGDIEGVYSLVAPTSLFGPKFSFTPNNGVLQPGRLQAIQVCLHVPPTISLSLSISIAIFNMSYTFTDLLLFLGTGGVQ